MPKQIRVTDVDLRFLVAINRFHYLTVAQAGRLLYPRLNDNNRYVQRRLKELADAGYLLRFIGRQTPRLGSTPNIFTLARRGRQLLAELRYSVTPYFRPSEEEEKVRNDLFMTHTLAAVDVLIAADMLCQLAPVTCEELRCERELRSEPVQVDVPPLPTTQAGTRRVTVVPDGWLQLQLEGNPRPYSISLELDRGSEDRKAWRRKVAALSTWAQGPYQQAFETDNITIAVVTINSRRRDKLREWTGKELAARGLSHLADIFLFTSSDPVATPPRSLFFDPLWYLVDEDSPVPLLPSPQRLADEQASPRQQEAVLLGS